MMMELDEMKAAWQELNRRIERSDALSVRVDNDLKIHRVEVALRRWLWLPTIELLLSLVVGCWTTIFLLSHADAALSDPLGALPALVLLVFCIIGVAACVRQFGLIAGIDYADAVLAIQHRLIAVRALRIRMTQFGLLLWLPLWPFFMALLVQSLMGWEVYHQFRAAWFVTNVGFGLLAVALLVWAAKRYGDRLRRMRWLQRLADDTAGRGLVAAMRQLGETAQFADGADPRPDIAGSPASSL
jgi:serine/threonine-protein kinase